MLKSNIGVTMQPSIFMEHVAVNFKQLSFSCEKLEYNRPRNASHGETHLMLY